MQALAVINKVTLFLYKRKFSWGKYLEVGFLDCVIDFCLICKELSMSFSHFVPLPAMEECSRFSQASEHLLCRVVKSAGKSSTSVSEAVSHCGFNLHFPMADDGEYLFM